MHAAKTKALMFSLLLTLSPWAQSEQTGLSGAGSEDWAFTLTPYLWAVGPAL